MLNRIKVWWFILVIAFIINMLLVVIGYYYFNRQIIIISTVILFIDVILVGFLLVKVRQAFVSRNSEVSQFIASDIQEGFNITKAGLMSYSEDYEITWISEVFAESETELLSQKLTIMFPETQELFFGDVDQVEINYKNRRYMVRRSSKGRSVLWLDITEVNELSKKLVDTQNVLGTIHLDNYSEFIQGIDDNTIAQINTNIRQEVVNWASENNMVIRRIRDDRFILFLDEAIYKKIEGEQFSILEKARLESDKLNVPITLSMAFSRGTDDLRELEKSLGELIELALTRGGDQVVVKEYQEDIKFFGGSSEAHEKRNRVKARVMTKSVGELTEAASKVYVVGHQMMDFDCVGAMFAMGSIAQAHNDNVYIVIKDVEMDKQLRDALNLHNSNIEDKYQMINEEQALFDLDDESIVVCVDHHSDYMCAAPKLVKECDKIVVIDHHRRGEYFLDNAILVYIEPSASSTCELLAEMIDYQSNKIEIDVFVSTLMLAGVIVDTNHFRVRSGTRTFAAASLIKGFGADVNEADNFLKEDFDEFETRYKFYQNLERINNDELVACGEEDVIYTRTMLSKIADSLLRVSKVSAAFAIGQTDKDNWAISARSDGTFNVQVILEKMGGGGHYSAAALQRSDTSMLELKEELLAILKEGNDESNIVN